MAGIFEVKTKIMNFFQNEMGREPEAVHFLKLAKSEEGWEGTVEITEPNEYLKKIGYPPIFDKNRYLVLLDANLNVVSYELEEK